MKTHSAPYVPLTKTREQIAEHIKAGYPSPVTYQVHGGVKMPIHLMRANPHLWVNVLLGESH